MPARKARTPRAGPDLQPVLPGGLPEREVARMSLSRIDLAARAGDQLVRRVSGQLAVRGKARDVVVDGAADVVRMSQCDQPPDQADHLRYVLRGLRVMGRSPDVELGGVIHE